MISSHRHARLTPVTQQGGNCGGFGSRPLSPARQLLGGVTRRPTDQRDAMPAFAGVRVNSWVKLHHPRDLSQPLDDVGCDITDAYELAWVFPQPRLTQAGFTPPTTGSPASFSFQMIKFAHGSKSLSSVRRGSEHTAGAMTCVRIGFAK
jgi:hypothetical protein